MRSGLRRALDPLLPVGRFSAYDKRIVFIIWVAGVIQGFGQSQASASLPFTRVGLGLSEGEMSLMLGLARLAAFAALPIGWLGDHRGRRRPFLIAMTVVVIGGAGAGLAVDAWQFGLLHALLRTGTAAASALAVVILAETVSGPIRSYAISFFRSGGVVRERAGLDVTPAGGERSRVVAHPPPPGGGGFPPPALPDQTRPRKRRLPRDPEGGHWRELVSGPWARRFWTVIVINLFAAAFGAVGAAFSTERLIEGVGMSTGSTVAVLLGGGTLGAVGFFVGGHLSDAWGRRRTSITSLLLTIVGGVTLYTSTSIPVIVVAAMVSAFGTFAFVPSGGAHRAELFPTRLRSSANTAASNAGLVGSALGLISGIYTIDTFGLSNTIYLLSVGVAVAAALTATLDETRGQDLTAVDADRR
jgi:MFS transporter, putative metabolite:H+ symporter